MKAVAFTLAGFPGGMEWRGERRADGMRAVARRDPCLSLDPPGGPLTLASSAKILVSTHPKTDWAKAITARWQDSVWAIVEVGRVLIQAKEALEHGEFLEMVGDLPFGPKVGQLGAIHTAIKKLVG